MISGIPPAKAPDRAPHQGHPVALAALVLATIVLVLQAGGEDLRLWLRYDRPKIAAGQVWRLVTGHLVHLGWSHAMLNATALVLIFAGFERTLRPGQWLWVGVGAMLAIDLGLWIFQPQVSWYVGLSGVLHGLVAAAALSLWATAPRVATVMLIFLAGKLLWEAAAGPLPMTAELAGGDVVVGAHLWGTLGGGLTALMLAALRRSGPPL